MSQDDNTSQDQRNPAEQAAQNLANLLGRSVAGFIPSSNDDGESLPPLDLDIELFRRRNVSLASVVVMAGLLRSKETRRQAILRHITPEYFGEKSFDRFLFERIATRLHQHEDISLSEIETSVTEFGPTVYGEPSDERSLVGYRFTVTQILSLAPSPRQIDQAIELRKIWARKKGIIE